MLRETGSLIIVERSRLTVGEAPYDNGLIRQKNFFGAENVKYEMHSRKKYIEKYTIKKGRLKVTEENVRLCVEKVRRDAYDSIKRLKDANATGKGYKNGLEMAVWLHQYANAPLIGKEFMDKE